MIRIILIISGIAILSACNSSEEGKTVEKEENTAILVSSGNGLADCQNLTTDNNGNPVISWVEGKNNEACLYYATSTDNGTTFNEPIKVSPTLGLSPHHESMPKVAFKADGTAIAVYQSKAPTPENRFAGAIYYVQSFDKGTNWSTPNYLHADTSEGIGRSYFDITALPNGEVGAIWLDGRKKSRDGSTLFFAKTNEKNGFQNEIELDDKTCQCCRTEIYVDKNNNINATYRDIINDSIRDMVHLYSNNLGESFSTPKRLSNDNWVINGCPHTGPSMSEDKDGLHFYWFTMGNGEGVYHTSTKNNGDNFAKRTLLNKNAKHPQTASLRNGGIAVVWEETFKSDSTFINRLGFSANNKNPKYITPDSVNCSYPVALGIKNNKVLVAWSQKDKKLTQVYFKLISTKNNITFQ